MQALDEVIRRPWFVPAAGIAAVVLLAVIVIALAAGGGGGGGERRRLAGAGLGAARRAAPRP